MNPKLIPYIQRRKAEIEAAKELLIKLEEMINSLENDLEDFTELNGLNKIFDRPIKKGVDRTEYYLDR